MISFSKARWRLKKITADEKMDVDELKRYIELLEIIPRKPVKGRNWQFLRERDFDLVADTVELLREGKLSEAEIDRETCKKMVAAKKRRAARKRRREERIERRANQVVYDLRKLMKRFRML